MQTIFVKVPTRADLPEKGSLGKIYQVEELGVNYHRAPGDSNGWFEVTAEQLETATFFDRFTKAYFDVKMEIAYDKNWSNGVGGQSNGVNSVHAPKIKPGEVVKCLSTGNRRIILIGTHYGNVLMYDRYNFETNPVVRNYVVYDVPEQFSSILDICDSQGTLDDHLLEEFIGIGRDNIGRHLKLLFESIRDSKWVTS